MPRHKCEELPSTEVIGLRHLENGIAKTVASHILESVVNESVRPRARVTVLAKVLFLLCMIVIPGSTGCAWLLDSVLRNTVDRDRYDTEGLTKKERVRKFEEKFLRDKDRKAYLDRVEERNHLNELYSPKPESRENFSL